MNCPFCGSEELVRIADMEGKYYCLACRHSFNDLGYRENATQDVKIIDDYYKNTAEIFKRALDLLAEQKNYYLFVDENKEFINVELALKMAMKGES